MRIDRTTAALLAALLLAPAAAAQEDSGTPAETRRFQAWTLACPGDGNTGENGTGCRVVQGLTMKDSDRRILTVEAGRVGQRPVMVVTTPLGVALPAGVALKVDEDEQTDRPYATCVPQGCRASFPLDEGLLPILKRGLEMRIGFKDSRGETVVIPVSLKGFTAAWTQL